MRAKNISNVNYRLVYALIPGGKTFHGRIDASFELLNLPSEEDEVNWTFLDYRGKVKRVSINDKVLNLTDIACTLNADDRIIMPPEVLKVGVNTVQVEFESDYKRDCEGLHYYKDPEDNEEYLYS